MTSTRHHEHGASTARRWVRGGTLVAAILLVLTAAPTFAGTRPSTAAPALAAPLPRTISATYVDRAEGPYVFRDRKRDLTTVSRAFNTAVLSATPWRYGDTSLVRSARAAGLAAVLEFDDKAAFVSGTDISRRVSQIIATTKANPGQISGILVADQLNKGTLTVAQQLSYLRATGGRFHAELPGVPVFVDAGSWELTCGQPQQASCGPLAKGKWKLQTNAVLTTLVKSGHIDGIFLSNNLKAYRADVNTRATAAARALFPRPFRLVARSSHVSFPERFYTGSAQDAAGLVRTYVRAPRTGGADGTSLWSWHRPWKNDRGAPELRTFLDKDGSTNPLWNELVASRP